jgi:hypothetical protein
LLLISGLGAAGCSTSGGGCAGQCGPPFQLQVVFRPGTPADLAAAAMQRCQAEPIVVRVGRVRRLHGLGGPSGSLIATVFTKAMSGSRPQRLLKCLRMSSSVTTAGFPD